MDRDAEHHRDASVARWTCVSRSPELFLYWILKGSLPRHFRIGDYIRIWICNSLRIDPFIMAPMAIDTSIVGERDSSQFGDEIQDIVIAGAGPAGLMLAYVQKLFRSIF